MTLAAREYGRVSIESSAAGHDPHALVLLLFDGALTAARLGLGHLGAGRIPEKAAAVSKATRIVEEGLKLSLDRSAGGELAQRLGDLYDYMVMRLLQANLRNDARALAEVIKLLDDLRGAWSQIRERDQAALAAPSSASTPGPVAAASPPGPRSSAAASRFLDVAAAGRARVAIIA